MTPTPRQVESAARRIYNVGRSWARKYANEVMDPTRWETTIRQRRAAFREMARHCLASGYRPDKRKRKKEDA